MASIQLKDTTQMYQSDFSTGGKILEPEPYLGFEKVLQVVLIPITHTSFENQCFPEKHCTKSTALSLEQTFSIKDLLVNILGFVASLCLNYSTLSLA